MSQKPTPTPLVGDPAALFADVRRKYQAALPGTLQAAKWFRLEEVLNHAEALIARAEKAEAQAAGEAGPFFAGFQRRAEELQHEYFAMKQRAEKAEARVKEVLAELSEQEKEKLLLVLDNKTTNKRLVEALESLGDMYDQYTPGKYGHDFMSAGEGAQDVLGNEGLLDDAYNFIGIPPQPEA